MAETRRIRATRVALVSRETTARSYNAIDLVIGDLHFACDLTSDDRDIRLAKRLADDHGVQLYVAEHLRERVAKALGGDGRR